MPSLPDILQFLILAMTVFCGVVIGLLLHGYRADRRRARGGWR